MNVVLDHDVERKLRRTPGPIVKKLQRWISDVMNRGVDEVRKLPGYHDEPLAGKRRGQRSIRLSRLWRALYEVKDFPTKFIEVMELTPHDYRVKAEPDEPVDAQAMVREAFRSVQSARRLPRS